MGRMFDSGRGMEGSGHIMSEQDDIDSDFPPHDEDTLISVDENDEPDEIYYSSQSGRPGQEQIFHIGDDSDDGESIEEYYSGSDRDEDAGYNEDNYGHKYHPAHEGDESDSSPTSVTAPVRESGSSRELEVQKKEKKSKSFLKKIFGGSKKNLTGGMFKKKRMSELSDGDIERSESVDEQGTSGKSSIPFPDESNKSYDISVVSEQSKANKQNEDDESESSYNIEVIDSPGPVKGGIIKGHSTKHKQEVRRTSFEKQCPGVAEETEEDDDMIEDEYKYKTYQIRLPEYPEDTNAKRDPELTPDTPEFKKKKNKKKEKKSHASALASRSPGTSSRVDYTGQIASISHASSNNKLQNEIHRLKTLVELMMTRMELYERQSECLVEASVEHDRQWKLASIENFKAASQKPDKQSAMDEQLSNIKALLIERSIQDKWIRKLEDIQRGYEQRLAETQTQLKTVRKEHIKTNKAIISLKKGGGEILTESTRTDQTPEDMIEDNTKNVAEMETPVARNVPLQRWTSDRDTSNKSQSQLNGSTNPTDASKHSMQSLEPEGRIVKTSLLEEMIVSWHTDATEIDARDMSPLSVRGDKKKKKKKDKKLKKKKSKSSKSVKSLDVSKSAKSFALE